MYVIYNTYLQFKDIYLLKETISEIMFLLINKNSHFLK